MSLTVSELKTIKFSRLSVKEQIKIKQRGRSTPCVAIVQSGISHNKRYIRSFNSDWYKKKTWLCGCEVTNALYCFPCLLMGGDSVWSENGFKNISRMSEKTAKHESSITHIDNAVSLALLGSANMIECSNESYRQTIIKHNENVTKNRQILSKIIDCIKFCGNFELSFGDHNEKEDSFNPDVFEGLINFATTFDSQLSLHLYNKSPFIGTCKPIQNELLDCMLQICRNHIMAEIDETSYVAVMADDATDVSEHTQMVIVFRYELNGEIFERFWGYFDPEDQTVDGISKCILDQVDIILKDEPAKLIAQTFDGANVMRGEKESVQCKIKETYKYAHFIHCYAHQLDLIMKSAATTSTNSRIFFSNLLAIPDFFSNSPEKLSVLHKHMNDRISKPDVAKWNINIRTVNKVYKNLESFKQCFEELQSDFTATDKTINDLSILLQLLNDENFLFWLEFFHKVTSQVKIIFNQMQSRQIDVLKIKEYLNNFNDGISEIQNSYCTLPLSESRMMEVTNMCNVISADVNLRYTFTNQLIAAKLFDKKNFKCYDRKMPNQEVSLIVESYPMLEQQKLMTELQVFYDRTEMHNFHDLLSLSKYISENHLNDALEEISKLLKILITIPMTTVEPERCFSTIKKVKTFLKNTMNQEKLSALTMLSIEKNMISKIPKFNEKVIDLFSTNENRQMDFIMKF